MRLDLSAELAVTKDHQHACRVVVDHLVRTPGFKPSVYLERGGRLRCQAARTYRQVLDGMPPSAGVIGRTFRRGQLTIVEDVTTCPDYLEITPGVRAEICAPVRAGSQVIGVISVESLKDLDPATPDRMEHCAALLGRRLEELGGALEESPAQRLVRLVAGFRAMSGRAEVERAVLEIAREVAGMDSAALLAGPPEGPVVVLDSVGPLAGALRNSSQQTLRATVGFVAAGASCYTVGERGGADFRSLSALRDAGACSLFIMPLGEGPDARVLVVTDRVQQDIVADLGELLELLCSQAESALHAADLVENLRIQAATDSLTGLGHHKAFHARLAAAGTGRTAVLAIDLDHFKAVNDGHGHLAGDRLLREVAAVLSAAVRQGDQVFRVGGDEFAAVVGVDSRAHAIELADRLAADVRRRTSITVSIGVSLASGSESLTQTFARADRALYAAKAGGRDGAKLLR